MLPTTPQPITSISRRFLCIAYAFPPINRSGTFRTLGFIKHLAHSGWLANVITAEPKDEPVDDRLISQIPGETIIHRVRWEDRVETLKRLLGFRRTRIKDFHTNDRELSDSIQENNKIISRSFASLIKDWGTGLLHLPDSRSGWILPAISSAKEAIKHCPIDLIYSTSPYASAHLIALEIKRQTTLPWIADFRDPWCGNPFANKQFQFHRLIEKRMERKVLENADRIVVNTPAAQENLLSRYPRLQHKCVTILNGFDADIMGHVTPIRTTSTEIFSLIHCGQFYGPRSPMPIFKAIHALIQRKPELARRFKLTLVGSARYDGTPLAVIAKELGVDSVVDVIGTKSHSESLRYMAGADGLALIGSTGASTNLQIPNKLFEYLAMRKPVLALTSDNHPAIDILRRAKVTFASSRPDDVHGITTALDSLMHVSSEHNDEAKAAIGQFDRKHRAQELADLFNQLVTKNETPRGRVLRQASTTVTPNIRAKHPIVRPDESQTPTTS